MQVKFSGLNARKGEIEQFSFELKDTTLANLHFTIDQIYFFNKATSNLSIFDFEEKKFKNFTMNPNRKCLSVSTNTNHLFNLISDDFTLQIEQFNGEKIIKRMNLNGILPVELDKLIVVATDVNVYVFENINDELICKFDMKSAEGIDPELLRNETRLNESAVSAVPLNKVLINGKIKQFSSGKEHILMLTEDGRIFSFGLGIKG